MTIEWWYWVVGGVLLILLELAIPAFFVLWFGLGALLVGLLMLLAGDLSLTTQLLVWGIGSVAMVALWFRVFRRDRHKTLIGTADGTVLGEVGLLVGAVEPFQRGKVRFQRPILGADEWVCVAETAIAAGERVRVVSVEGSFIKVAKVGVHA
ncbi:MAG TPA: NfeD family protein [Pseudomonas sp.]|uniref:NfeD family protein n=1 Tax=Pseudomonas sp. TaxID=306 RepID=UPI002C0C297B|nr:NfeD family protein [Pseudomonas sp.]HTO20427.1 NfeD family protein [Pseudomonas sp.]